jgi:hypothetical protein
MGFMIFAFLVGMFLVFALAPAPSRQQTAGTASTAQTSPPEASARVAQAQIPGYSPPLLIALPDNHFLYVTPDERFFICRFDPKTGLEVVEVYQLSYKPDRFLTELAKRKTHGWYFDALSVGKLAVVKAKTEKFEQVCATSNWENAEEAAKDLAAAGGIAPLLGALKSENYAARRGAALSLAELGYIQTVPVLTELLREKRSVRERVTPLLIKLTGKDFISTLRGEDMEPAIGKYLEWWKENQKTEGGLK